MKKSIKKGKIFQGTFGRIKLIEDFLPSPEELKKAKAKVYHKDGSYSIYTLNDTNREDK